MPAIILAGAFLVCVAMAAQERPADAARRGRELAGRVLQAQDTSGFRLRARVLVGDESDPAVLQVRIVGRKEGGGTRVLFQILWPASLKGLAAVIERRQNATITGFLFEPPERATELTPALLSTPFGGTALTIEDLAEDFWRWPQQRVAGQGRAGDQSCTILESRPSTETASAYALVRSCISLKKATPLWVEKLAGNGKRIKRIAFESPDRKIRGQDFSLVMTVESDAALPRTRVEFLKSDRGVAVSAEEFSLARIRNLGNKHP